MEVLVEIIKKDLLNSGTSIIYLNLDKAIYPDKKWTDFVFMVLTNWNIGMQKILKGSNEELFSFYDGNIYFRIKKHTHSSNYFSEFGNINYDDDYEEIYTSEWFEDISLNTFLDTLIVSNEKVVESLKTEVYLRKKEDFERMQASFKKLLVLIDKNDSLL